MPKLGTPSGAREFHFLQKRSLMEYPSSTESIYTGGFSGLDPDSSEYFIGEFEKGKRLNAAYMGQSINPTVPDQLGEVVKTLKSGIGVIEVQALNMQGDVDQAIPIQHFKEMRAIMKLSGVKPSLHGPILDPVGLGKNGLDEVERVGTQKRFSDVMEKAHVLDQDGNIPVVFHASAGYPGTVVWKKDKDGHILKDKEGKMITELGHVINQETGQMTKIQDSIMFRPSKPDELMDAEGKLTGHLFEAEDKLESVNRTEWDNQMVKVAELAKQTREVMGNAAAALSEYRDLPVLGEANGSIIVQDPATGSEMPLASVEAQGAYKQVKRAEQFLENAELSFGSAFETAFKYGTSDQRKDLLELSKDYAKKNDSIMRDVKLGKGKKAHAPTLFTPIEKSEIIDEFSVKLRDITSGYDKKDGVIVSRTPQLFAKVEDFAIDKAAETFGAVALDAYQKFGEKAPVIALENIDPERGAVSTGAQLRETVEKTRENFANLLMEREHLGKKKAEDMAERLIGATWDVGHVNQHRKFGMDEEALIEQTKEVAKMVKHVHLTDNFGFADTHLIPGMGNVPIKEHLAELEKAGVLGKVKKIVEGGGWAQLTKGATHPAALRAFGSPIYGMNQSSGGYWNQAQGTIGSYFGGYGTVNPQVHHSIYGAGLTSLPQELGGAIPGGGSRFSGNSMT